ncbi:MAG: SDR family oxidoreductase [bacterium]|nr:SDR family oxidoreductase [bacterium]
MVVIEIGPQQVQYDFSNHVALVTGGTKGIGKAIVSALLHAECQVVVSYSSDEKSAQQFLTSLSAKHSQRTLLLRSDVSVPQEVESLFSTAQKEFGQPVSMVVNNAGILNQGNFSELSEANWDRTLAVNLKGPFLVGQQLLKSRMNGATMVNISSVGGQTGGPKAPDYSASKAGLISLTRSLARLGAPDNIRVNAVAPGWIKTDIFDAEQLENLEIKAQNEIPLARLGTPDEVARSVMFLLSQESSYLTGHCLNINGGMYFG